MKIAYDPQIFCAQTYGGISRYFCEIASRIAQVPEVDVSIFAPLHLNAYLAHMSPGLVSGFPAPNTDSFRTRRGTNYPRLALRGLGLLMGAGMLQAMGPDIVHETYFSPYRLGARRARRVLTIYDMIHEKFPTSFSSSDKTVRYKVLAAERADHVICISESTRCDAINILGLPADKTSVIYLGFDLMSSSSDEKSDSEGFWTESPYLLYVGNRGGYKNFSRLLEAYGTSLQLKSDYKLLCFGGGKFQLDEINKINALGLDGSRVMQIGGDDLFLSELYKHASAFIYPSLYEGFGIPPLEAMSHDCPVICSNTSSMPEVVGEAGAYFDPSDTGAMQAEIERVVASESDRKLLVLKGRERLKSFSWDRCAAETLDIYKNLA